MPCEAAIFSPRNRRLKSYPLRKIQLRREHMVTLRLEVRFLSIGASLQKYVIRDIQIARVLKAQMKILS